ncbi:MAG TPA: protease pro-enzyme activation domain-containing protein [Xanthomonadaceae bacterium]|jgi:subtilase family serine protease
MKAASHAIRCIPATHPRKALALAVTALLFAGSAFAGAGTAPAASALSVAPATHLRHGDAVLGALPLTQPIHVAVALNMRDRAGLETFVTQAANDRKRGVFSSPMTSEQFMATHAPTQAQVQAVTDYLSARGFSNIQVLPNRMMVTADGTARSARDAFMTTLAQVRTGDGRMAWTNTDAVRVPAALADKVRAVVGLQTVYAPHTFAKVVRPLTRQAMVHPMSTTNPVYPFHFTPDFQAVYSVGSAAAATNIPVGIIVEGDLTQTKADLVDFTTDQGLPAVTVQVVGPGSNDTAGLDEWSLDTQAVVGMSGGVSKLVLYKMPSMSNTDLLANFTTAVSANAVKVINVSLGECEFGGQDGSAAAGDDQFAIAIAQGQTFSISTGDSGADECKNGGITPSWPANSQYIVAVAGTTLTTTNTSPSVYTSETVWSGSGGSPSTYESMPTWQQNFADGTHHVPGYNASSPKRDVADVAFDADGSTGAAIYFNGGLIGVGGTSLAAPIFSGTWARMVHKYPTIGFAGPVIYALPTAAFHDITSGNNGGETAGVSYDSASGRGSLIVGTAITDAAGLGDQKPVVNFTWVRSGQTFAFTDATTVTTLDSDSGIASYSWDFGDGTTSTASNPTHYYPVPGSYFVKETVKDKVGASGSKGYSVSPAPVQELKNTGFETTSTAWTISPTSARINNASLAHAGNWYVALGGVTGETTHHIQQGVTLPTATSASLSFYTHITTTETGATANDILSVQVTDTSGTVLGTLATYSNLDATSGYVLKTLDMSAYLGQAVRVKFLATNNGSLPTTFAIDDVTVSVQ